MRSDAYRVLLALRPFLLGDGLISEAWISAICGRIGVTTVWVGVPPAGVCLGVVLGVACSDWRRRFLVSGGENTNELTSAAWNSSSAGAVLCSGKMESLVRLGYQCSVLEGSMCMY